MDKNIVGNLELINSSIEWGDGTGNIIFIPQGKKVILKNSAIRFYGNNSLVFINSNTVSLNLNLYSNNTFYLGENASTNKCLNINLSEEKSVFIGNDLLSSFDVWIRTADPHIIYDSNTYKRINPSKSVFIGDHVWLGQACFIFKGSIIGSGSIIGAKALTSNKKYKSNCSFGGIPAKLLKENIFFLKTCVHRFTSNDTSQYLEYKNSSFIYSNDNDKYVDEIIAFLDSNKSVNEKIEYLKNISTNKNRFAI